MNYLIAFVVGLLSMLPLQAAENSDTIVKAWELHKKGEHLRSASLLSGRNEEELYLLWLNEKEIGPKAHFCSTRAIRGNEPYCAYVKKNQKYFYYYEPGADHFTTSKRLEEIRALNQHSTYAMEIEYSLISDDEKTSGEYTDDFHKRAQEMIKTYNDFLSRYPGNKYSSEIQEKISAYRKVTPAEGCKGMVVYGACQEN